MIAETMIAETPRLVLRRFTPADLDALAVLFSDPEVMRFSPGVRNRPATRLWLEAAIASYAENGWGHWAAVGRDDGRFVGFCGLKAWEVEGRREVEIGYRLATACWGRGLATEAATAARDAGFGRYGLERLVSLIEAANVASWRVAEKVGMRYERDVGMLGKRLRLYAIGRGNPPCPPFSKGGP